MGRGELDRERLYLNKWEMYKALEGEEIGPCTMPDTALLTAESLSCFLEKYKSIYVKPIDRWGGADISRLIVNETGLRWALQGRAEDKVCEKLELLIVDCVDYYQMQPCIVQQAVPTAYYRGHLFDVRVHMQRDENDQWVCAGFLARVGGDGSIVSNVGAGNGYVITVDEAWSGAYNSPMRTDINDKFEQIGNRICTHLDQYHMFFEVGIDLVVDVHENLWLIEVNTDDNKGAPDCELFDQLTDHTLYRQIQARYNGRLVAMIHTMLDELFSAGQGDGSDTQG